jgi:hypothetical protein
MDDIRYPFVREMGGHIVDVARYIDEKQLAWSAFNPSIGFNGKSVYAMTLRSSNYYISEIGTYEVTEGPLIANRLYFSELDKNLKPKKVRPVDFDGLETEYTFDRGVEDARLFWRDGWHFTSVVLEKGWCPRARMGVASFNPRTNKVTDFSLLPTHDFRSIEKNWMVNPEEDSFEYIYGPNQVIFGELMQTWMTETPELSGLRGSSHLWRTDEDGFIGLMHRTFIKGKPVFNPHTFSSSEVKHRNYVHYFVKFDNSGFITHLSDGFQFFSPGVEFGGSIVPRGKEFLIPFGRKDLSSHIAVLPQQVVFESLKPVKY